MQCLRCCRHKTDITEFFRFVCWYRTVPSGCQPSDQTKQLGSESACRLPSSTPIHNDTAGEWLNGYQFVQRCCIICQQYFDPGRWTVEWHLACKHFCSRSCTFPWGDPHGIQPCLWLPRKSCGLNRTGIITYQGCRHVECTEQVAVNEVCRDHEMIVLLLIDHRGTSDISILLCTQPNPCQVSLLHRYCVYCYLSIRPPAILQQELHGTHWPSHSFY